MAEFSDPLLSSVLQSLPAETPVFFGPDGFELTGDALRARIAAITAQLADLPKGTRVATLLPDSPETALLMLALVHHAQVMPLNPALTDAELTAILRSGSAALMLSGSADARARALAEQTGLPQASIDADGVLTAPKLKGHAGSAGLILLTSGSTGTPKRVPLTPKQLHLSAGRIARALHLSPDDCAVHALPMFHIGAIVDLLLAPLSAGGKVRIAAGMGAQPLAEAVRAGGTWLQLVPTMLARLRAELSTQDATDLGKRLRFIRSVSSDLAPHVQSEAESFFAGTPIIQMYGMTETAGQITTNPLPPEARKFGSVGRAFDVDLRIEQGEVQVRGDSVTAGYEGTERSAHFTPDGWLRTGDLGRLDEDGFLFLTGRAKEMINRGGEKISPHEVEHAALSIPGVIEAAAFARPHPSLGEEVGLALTLQPGTSASSVERSLETRLAAFKRPRKILVLDPLPRLGSGKIDRRALATLPQTREGAPQEALSPVAQQVRRAWLSVLPDVPPETEPDFFDAGGDSLSGAQFLFEVEKLTGRSLPQNLLYDAPEFDAFCAAVETAPLRAAADRSDAKHVFLQSRLAEWDADEVPGVPFMRVVGAGAPGTPLFWCAQEEGEYEQIAAALGQERPIYLMRSLFLMLGKDDAMNDVLAQDYATAIASLQPEGPLALGGFCEGAKIMRFAARHLAQMGRETRVLLSWDQWFETPQDVPVLHLWSDERYTAYRRAHLFPERVIAAAHPAGYEVIRVGGAHTEVITKGPLDPFLPALRRALSGAALVPPPPARVVFDRPQRGKIALSAPRFFRRGAAMRIEVTLDNDSGSDWPASADAPLYLAAKITNLDGHIAQPVAGLCEITEPVPQGRSDYALEITASSEWLPVRLEVELIDSASQRAAAQGVRPARRLIWPIPF